MCPRENVLVGGLLYSYAGPVFTSLHTTQYTDEPSDFYLEKC